MKASSNFKTFAITLLFIELAQMSPPLAGPPAKEKFTLATNVNAMVFPPRPEGVTDILIVSSPVVIKALRK